MSSKTNVPTTWKISKLRQHPKQAVYFRDLPEAELAALAADIDTNGLREPIHVLPDGTIVAGHQRFRAAKMLGWTEVPVIVRADLDQAGAEALLIGDNLVRRHLSPLERARCIRRLMEIEEGRRPGGLFSNEVEQLKEKVGRQLHLGVRSVNRYLLICNSPKAVQDAFDRNEITLVNAGRIALLDEEEQSFVADKIEAGEPAARVVADALKRPMTSDGFSSALRQFLTAMLRADKKLRGHTAEIPPIPLYRSMDVMKRGVRLLRELIKKAESHPNPDVCEGDDVDAA